MALFWLLFFVLSTVAEVVTLIALQSRPEWTDTAENMVQPLCEILAVVFMVYAVERDRLTAYGLPRPSRRHARDVLIGALWGAGSITFVFVALILTRNVSLQHGQGQPNLSGGVFVMLIVMILVGFGEEMTSRGYTMMTILRQTGKPWLAGGVSSVIFASLHGLNPNVSWSGLVNVGLFGVLAAYMAIQSGSLWMPIAYHAAWDFFEGNVYGFPDSGTITPSIYHTVYLHDNLLNGGGFGPEGGVLVSVVWVVGMAGLFTVVRRRQPGPAGE